MEYRKGTHTVYNIEYHFVWVTKYRYHVLVNDLKTRAREIIRQSCMQYEIKIIKGHVSKDHIHLLVSCPPHLAPSKIIQKLKGKSSYTLQREFPHLKKRYWGQHLWAKGYFCTSVGNIDEKTIRDYIEGHLEISPDDSFSVNDD